MALANIAMLRADNSSHSQLSSQTSLMLQADLICFNLKKEFRLHQNSLAILAFYLLVLIVDIEYIEYVHTVELEVPVSHLVSVHSIRSGYT